MPQGERTPSSSPKAMLEFFIGTQTIVDISEVFLKPKLTRYSKHMLVESTTQVTISFISCTWLTPSVNMK